MSQGKPFGAFVKQAASYGLDYAKSVELYVENRTDTHGEVVARIRNDRIKDVIDNRRMEVLLHRADFCQQAWMRVGRIVDMRDPRDWATIGEGCRMHKVHKDSDFFKKGE